jgi:hypothetical protein
MVTVVLFDETDASIGEFDFDNEQQYFRWLALTRRTWAYILTYINRGTDGEELYL